MKSLGIDFGGTSIKFGVVSGKEIIDHATRIEPKDYPEPTDLIEAIAKTANDLKSKHPELKAIGCGVPGFVDFPNGIVINLTNVPGWVNIPLKAELERLTGLPTTIDNDANAMAIAEWQLGAAKGSTDAICVTLGTGVGGGVICNGNMVRGATFGAGEIGQTSICYKGRMGAYNNVGALEEYLGNNEFAADAQAAYKDGDVNKDISECTPEDIAKAAQNSCHIALKCWDQYAQKLATSLASTCWLLNPEVIVIGGGIANADAVLFEPLKRHLHGQLSPTFKNHLKVEKAHFNNDAGILGCATLALSHYSSESS